ncbi:MAG TPA: membrane protein insertion efficiency factor YidD [Candidatus Eremiobacteraceae bacterium]|nr:membrane protein insertion efficiency factor YidD [Candidatus Eremiobacteraceae bacterium]
MNTSTNGVQLAAPLQEETRKSASVRAALFALDFYKVYLSPLFAGTCRYEPTCSRYAFEAIERFGVWRGICLGTKRLLRCHPLSRKFGFDPVPEKWEKVPANSTITAEAHEVRP